MSIGTMTFAGAGLDRADHIRADADKLAELMDWRARLLRLDGLDPADRHPTAFARCGARLADADPASELVFLGLLGGKGCFAEVSAALLGSVAPANPRLWAAMSSLARGAGDLWHGAQPGRLARPPPLLRALRQSDGAGQGRLAAQLHQ
jgi:NAD+ diphosphatase